MLLIPSTFFYAFVLLNTISVFTFLTLIHDFEHLNFFFFDFVVFEVHFEAKY